MKLKISFFFRSFKIVLGIFFVSILPVIGFSAQDCTEASLLQKPGTWKEGMKGSTTGIPADVLLKEKKVIAAIHNLMKQSYSPRGLDALYSEAYDRLIPEMSLGQYYYGLYLMPYSCVGNIAKPDEETNTSVFIKANNPEIPFSREVVGDEIDERDKAHYGWLKTTPVPQEGIWFLGEQEQSSGMGVKVKHYQWLITYDQRLPFQYVTRKEYLEKIIDLLQKVKQRELKKIETDYAADTQSRDRFYAGTKKYYEDKLSGVEKADKSLSPADLQQTAIVPAQGDFTGFLNEGERSAVILVKENPDYYNMKLSKGIPQLFSIVFEVDDQRPALAQAYADVMKALDFAALKNMLGK
jgi:hypothetical protein